MGYSCDGCGKGVQIGRNIRHKRGVAGGRWKRKAQKTRRKWFPNLHSARVIEGGKIVRKRLCTKCLRRAERPKVKKEDKEEVKKGPAEKLIKKAKVEIVKKSSSKDGKEKKTESKKSVKDSKSKKEKGAVKKKSSTEKKKKKSKK